MMAQAVANERTSRFGDVYAPGEDSASAVSARLRRSGYPYLGGVKCETDGGVTVLRGTVPSFHLKQLAQELAIHTPGVHKVENRLHVPRAARPTGRAGAMK